MHFPKRQDFVYLEGCTLPRDVDPSATFKLSLWHLGWADGCSSKPPTFKITANQLLDEYLTNSVMTAAEPLLLYQGPEDKVYKCSQTKEPLFFSCYVKGAARATSLLMLAACGHVCAQSGLGRIQPNTVPVHAGSDMPAGHCCNRIRPPSLWRTRDSQPEAPSGNARCHHLGIQTDELKA